MDQSPATFQRARTAEQRELRKKSILAAAAAMLAEMPVTELSLNELSRRVGLAKSNVTRYFETREAVLLELLDAAWQGWLDRLADEIGTHSSSSDDDVHRRGAAFAGAIATTVMADELLWELMSVSSAVLERNVSPQVARRYKLSATANTDTLGRLTQRVFPQLDWPGAFHFAGGALLLIGSMWPLAHPTAALLTAYEDPDLTASRLDGPKVLQELLITLLVGSVTRWQDG